tara:strand:- start:8852 stop:9178 length:327 start_codon:yes stop_codon:yes gene_type:complete
MVGYAANELLFLDTLLHAKAFENTAQIKTEKMLCFKLEIKTKNQEVNELKTQMELSKNNVGAFLDCEVNSGIEFSFKDYKVLKRNFGLFNTSYNQYKTEIFKHTGGIL